MRLESLPVLGSCDPIHDKQLQLTWRDIEMIIIRAVVIFKKLGRHCHLHAVGPTVLDRSCIRTLWPIRTLRPQAPRNVHNPERARVQQWHAVVTY